MTSIPTMNETYSGRMHETVSELKSRKVFHVPGEVSAARTKGTSVPLVTNNDGSLSHWQHPNGDVKYYPPQLPCQVARSSVFFALATPGHLRAANMQP